jgi:dihydroorotase
VKSFLITNGHVIDPFNDLDALADVLIVDGKIEAVASPGQLSAPEGVPTIAGDGYWVMPGLIDPHVHLRDPGFPEKETIASGLRAAAAGGFTAVAAMANTSPVNDTPAITKYMIERAHDAKTSRLIPVSAVTKGLRGLETVDFAAMAEAGARLFSDDGIPIDDQVLLARALDEIGGLGFAVSLHEEDRHLSRDGAVNAGEVSKRLGVNGYPASAEAQRIRRDLALAIGTESPVHIAHLSCAESIEFVRHARKNGANVTSEVTPHHFWLDEHAVFEWGPDAKMNPPLRTRADVDAIHAAMADGTISMIATDHAPHDPASKQSQRLSGCFPLNGTSAHLEEDAADAFAHAANGVIGLETALALALGLVHRQTISSKRLVEMMSMHPARLLRLEAGALSPGMSADVTVVDPNFEWTVEPQKFFSTSRNTPFAGMRLRGKAVMTIVEGEIVFDARGDRRD